MNNPTQEQALPGAGQDTGETTQGRTAEKPTDNLAAFCEFAQDHGLILSPGDVIADGEFHRVQTRDSKNGDKDGAYFLHPDTPPSGYVQNWKTGDKSSWTPNGEAELSQEDKEKIQAAQCERKRQQREKQEKAAQQARKLYQEGNIPDADGHPYLANKGISPLDVAVLVSESEFPANGLTGNLLLTPGATNENGALAIQTIQAIDERGEKRFYPGTTPSGAYYFVGQQPSETNSRIYACEGFATAVTLLNAGAQCVAYAFNADNLVKVAKALRSDYPEADIVIAADNDHETEKEGKGNPGVEKGHEAALAISGRLTVPPIEGSKDASDWNDYFRLYGKEATQKALSDEEQNPKTTTEDKPSIRVDGNWLDLIKGVTSAIDPHREVFVRAGEVVRLASEAGTTHFEPLTAAGACSEFERFCNFTKESGGEIEQTRLHENVTRLILQAPQFTKNLSRIDRIADYPMPVSNGSGFHTTPRGYDPATKTFTDPQGPQPQSMSLEKAQEAITDLLQDFCFAELNDDEGEHYGMNAVLYLLTCHCRFLIEPERSPIFYAGGNRPGVGKDYLLGLGPLLTTGCDPEFFPPTKAAEETRKRILTVCRSGARFMLVSNVKGHLSDEALEQAATSAVHTDRVLGKSEELTFPNTAIYGISGNGLSYSEDLARRMCPIELNYFGESVEERKYRHPDLYRYLKENRAYYLGALQTMVETWRQAGCPSGSKRKTSFGRWSEIVGGIVETCGLPNPINEDPITSTPNEEADHFSTLLLEVEQQHGENPVNKKELQEIAAEAELFPWLGDLENDQRAKTRFGTLLKRMERRRFDGAYLICDRNTSRPKFQIRRDG